jgi:hypothetical protein
MFFFARAVGAGAGGQVLTTDQLRSVGLSYCPVPGCQRQPGGFKSKQALKFHMQSHGGEKGDVVVDAPPPPAVLPAVLPAAPGGVRMGQQPGPFHCPEPGCGFGPGKKTLKSVKTAMQHAKKHAAPGAETFACDRCPRVFTLRYRLTEHSKTCGKKPFHCKCGLALGHKSSLKTHIAQWNKTAPGEHADVTPAEDGGAGGAVPDGVAGVAAGDDADAAALDAVVMAVGAGEADDEADHDGLNM